MLKMDNRGFTLIEMMLSVAIIGMLAGLALPVYQSFQQRNGLDFTAQSIADSLRRAQLYSRGSKNDSVWGVRIGMTTVTLFKGTSFASRDTSLDEVTSFSTLSLVVSGLNEVTFAKLSATPSTTGTTTLTATTTNDTRAVTLNSEGMVSY